MKTIFPFDNGPRIINHHFTLRKLSTNIDKSIGLFVILVFYMEELDFRNVEIEGRNYFVNFPHLLPFSRLDALHHLDDNPRVSENMEGFNV